MPAVEFEPATSSPDSQCCCSYVHEVVDLLTGASESQRQRAGREALSVAAVEHVSAVIPQEVLQQAGGS